MLVSALEKKKKKTVKGHRNATLGREFPFQIVQSTKPLQDGNM